MSIYSVTASNHDRKVPDPDMHSCAVFYSLYIFPTD